MPMNLLVISALSYAKGPSFTSARLRGSLSTAHPMLMPNGAIRSGAIHLEATDPVPALANAYTAAGFATAAAWTACAVVALSSHPNSAIDAVCGLRHNVLTIAQALTFPLPLAWAVTTSLRSAANAGWGRLRSATYRRLNLGLAAASFWMAAASFCMPVFAYGYDMYSPLLRLLATMAHAATALLCTGVWVCTVEPQCGHYLPRVIRGSVGSMMRLVPTSASDDPDAAAGRDGRNEYALCTALFTWFAILPVVSPFPLATVPAILGKRLSRAASGWTFLGAVVAYCLKVSWMGLNQAHPDRDFS